jgi:hypothetical protein
MSTTKTQIFSPIAFDKTLADLKRGVEAATASQAKATETAVKTAKDMAAFNQGTWTALVAANQAFATGAQDLAKQVAAASTESMNEALASWRAVVAAKTVAGQVEAHSALVRAATARALADGNRFALAGFALAEQAAAPLLARVVVASETFRPNV